jgi:predicted metal-dependent phosphoesterase TrpH
LSLVDLHTHTTESDGTLTPVELVRAAADAGVRVLAITDHDTITDSPEARDEARRTGVALIRGIELSCRHEGKSIHLLGYFFDGVSRGGFGQWLDEILESRRDRNVRLERRLKELGVTVTVKEAEAYGQGLTGRPHFARVMIDKGYVSGIREAFDRYLGESAPGYVERYSPDVSEAIERMRTAGAVPSLAHPIRVGGGDPGRQDLMIARFAEQGLIAIEAFHTDHSPELTGRFLSLASKYGLAVSGGSDFHGENKPGVELGTGSGNLRVPEWVVEGLRQRSPG